MYQKFKGWIEQKKVWVELLDKLRLHPRGFSFTKKAHQPHLNETLYPAGVSEESPIHLLVSTRRREYEEATQEYEEYEADWEAYLAGFEEYLKIGAEFHAAMTDPRVELNEKMQLIIASENDGHLMHNAAVLWIEANEVSLVDEEIKVGSEPFCQKQSSKVPNTIDDDGRLDYEEVLKTLWASELVRAHPAWCESQEYDQPRCKALLKYCIGRDDLDTVPTWNHPKLDEFRKDSHVTLGKVLVRRRTQFHDERIRVHPGYWGLYLVSPLFDLDRGFYDVEEGDADDNWLNYLETRLGMPDSLIRHESVQGTKNFQIYERIPRLYANPTITPPGVYLHRSRAHGRDDFLVLVTGQSEDDRECMVVCTKGVGADPDLIPAETAGQLSHTLALKNGWGNPSHRDFPFGYPEAGKEDNAGSWRNVGFCLMHGSGHDEIASVDFNNFGIMFDVARSHKLGGVATGFVEPFVAIEISCVSRNKARMPMVVSGVEGQGTIGYPVEVATMAPLETSLRLYKRRANQDYDYGHLPLEILEWERCYAKVPVPELLAKGIEMDIERLGSEIIPRIIRDDAIDEVRKRYYSANLGELERAVEEDVQAQLLLAEGELQGEYERAIQSKNPYSGYNRLLTLETAGSAEERAKRAQEKFREQLRTKREKELRGASVAAKARFEEILAQHEQQIAEEVEKKTRERTELHLQEKRLAIEDLRNRMLLAARIMHGMLATYVIFVDHGWATDTYTGSFSGRNYNSGVRDSNEWGEFVEPSEKTTLGGRAGEGLLRAHIDIGNIPTAIGTDGDVFLSMGLADIWHTGGVDLGTHHDLVLKCNLMWTGCALHKCATEITAFFARAKLALDEIWEKADDRSNESIVKAYRKKIAQLANTLPYGLGDVFKL